MKFLLSCVVELLIGVLLLLYPIGFTAGILRIFGAIALLIGVLSILHYLHLDPETATLRHDLTHGILSVVLGSFCLCRAEWFILSHDTVFMLHGLIDLVFGVRRFQWAMDGLRLRQRIWRPALISAALTLITAVLILVDPFATDAALWHFIAIMLIATSLVDSVAFVLNRKKDPEPS